MKSESNVPKSGGYLKINLNNHDSHDVIEHIYHKIMLSPSVIILGTPVSTSRLMVICNARNKCHIYIRQIF